MFKNCEYNFNCETYNEAFLSCAQMVLLKQRMCLPPSCVLQYYSTIYNTLIFSVKQMM